MRNREVARLSTLRLISAAIKDRDIAARGGGNESNESGVPDSEILGILARMVRQREESARSYEEGGRLDLAEQERAEIPIIREFMPRQLSAPEVEAAIGDTIARVGATSIRDMGKVMSALKARYPGQIDFSKLGPQVKDRLN